MWQRAQSDRNTEKPGEECQDEEPVGIAVWRAAVKREDLQNEREQDHCGERDGGALKIAPAHIVPKACGQQNRDEDDASDVDQKSDVMDLRLCVLGEITAGQGEDDQSARKRIHYSLLL
ncbi:MAG TPA: hypothetical protein VIM09_02060 [Chthoniobacterales bacterium]